MISKIKNFFVRVGVRLGLIQELQSIEEHKKINVNEEQYRRIAKNKQIYQGYYPGWHQVNYKNSALDEKTRRLKTINMAKVSAQFMAKIVFNENCTVNIAEEKKDAAELINGVMGDNKFKREFQRYLEYGYALGGMVIKVAYDSRNNIRLYYATADSFFPLSADSENLDEALIVNKFTKNGKFYSLLEWNEWEKEVCVITNELYESTSSDELGKKVSLSLLYPDLQPKTKITNLTRQKFVYIKPNIANNKDLTSPLGISIFENAYDTLHQLDYMFDFFFREFKLGKRRVAVPSQMIKTLFPENGLAPIQVFDEDEEVFQQLNGEDSLGVNDLTVEIRADDIIKSINAMLQIYAIQIGASAGTFTFDGTGVKTATEVVSEDSATYQTRNSYVTIVEDGLKDLIMSIVDINNFLSNYDTSKKHIVLSRDDIGINFDDAVFVDTKAELDYYTQVNASKFMPKVKIIQKLFKLSEEEAQEWLTQIIEEERSSNPTLEELQGSTTLFGSEE